MSPESKNEIVKMGLEGLKIIPSDLFNSPLIIPDSIGDN